MSQDIYVQSNGLGELKAIFEDNGRVAYAYLLVNGKIEGDVWLYNRGEAPKEPEWNNRDLAPYRNPAEFALSLEHPADSESDIEIEWDHQNEEHPQVKIYVRRKLLGVLKMGTKPGWSKLAKKDGPLAKVLLTK